MKVEETDKYLKEFKDVLLTVSEDYTKRIDNIIKKYVNVNIDSGLENEKNVKKNKNNFIFKENENNKKVKTIGKGDLTNGCGKVKTIGRVNRNIENTGKYISRLDINNNNNSRLDTNTNNRVNKMDNSRLNKIENKMDNSRVNKMDNRRLDANNTYNNNNRVNNSNNPNNNKENKRLNNTDNNKVNKRLNNTDNNKVNNPDNKMNNTSNNPSSIKENNFDKNLISKSVKKEFIGGGIRDVNKKEKRSVEKVQKIKLNIKTPLKRGSLIDEGVNVDFKENKSSFSILHENIKDFVEEKVIKEDISSECQLDMMTSNNSLNFNENKFDLEKNVKNKLQIENSLMYKNEEEDNSGLTIFDLKNGDLKFDLSDSIVKVNEELDNLLAQFKNEIEDDRVLNVERCEDDKNLVVESTESKGFENQNVFMTNGSKTKNTIEKSSNTTFFSSGSPDSKDSSLIFYKRTPVDSLYKSVIDKQIRNSSAFRNSIRFDLNSYKPKTVVPVVKLNDEEDLLDNFKLPEWAKDTNLNGIVKQQSHIDLEKYFYYLEDLDVKKIFPYCSTATNESPNKFIK
ncbi:hypothetical protein CWI36_0140p0010 [Hamiltosporidium magnivora]|uniref:Inner centromere protein ARK-binding domain-containing protein n=2 Tax=Hamiltosporidium TaxID=1176354 RepID=A0A4Q9LJM8_9MICR|nr:hypothetical protein CWI36_0140p0010 [Hamiltosporidium magnivora]